jgi:hypothetical protein
VSRRGSDPSQACEEARDVSRLRRTAVVSTGVAVVLAMTVSGCGSANNDAVKAVAADFVPPHDWTMLSDRFEPDRKLCLGDNPCPSVERHWRLSKPLDLAAFTELVDTTTWSPTVSGACQPIAASSVLREVCAATADVDGFTATIQQLRTGLDGPTQVVLTVVETNRQ